MARKILGLASVLFIVLALFWYLKMREKEKIAPTLTPVSEVLAAPAAVPESALPSAAVPQPAVQVNEKQEAKVKVEEPWVPIIAAEHDVQESYAGFPYAPGWPIKLKGTFNSTPVIADLRGDGQYSIVVTASTPIESVGPVHKIAGEMPKPGTQTGMVFAFNVKGEVERNFPVMFGIAGRNWVGGVSVFLNGMKERLVVLEPGGVASVIGSDGLVLTVPGSSDSVDTPLLLDMKHDGTMAVFGGRLSGLITDEAMKIPNWSMDWGRKGAYVPVAGDVEGNGHFVMYQLMWTTKGTSVGDVMAFDERGNKLNNNWPKVIDDASWHSPVMGDICGDSKAEVVAAYGSHIFAWGWDGSKLPHTRDVVEGDQTLNGVLVDDVSASSVPPTLADLDGDGKAEIVLYDHRMKAIRAWHGDGTPAGTADGIIAKIPNGQAVSVVSLGDEAGVIDFFCGTYWIRLHANGKKEIKNMVPDDVKTPGMTQPTIVDVDGDGKADVLFVTADGRMFVYQTGLKYSPEKMQWPTMKADFQHSGMWKNGK